MRTVGYTACHFTLSAMQYAIFLLKFGTITHTVTVKNTVEDVTIEITFETSNVELADLTKAVTRLKEGMLEIEKIAKKTEQEILNNFSKNQP